MGAFGRDAPSMTHGAGAISRSPIAAAHAEKSGWEQSAPPMYGAQSHRPSSALHTPWRSHPGAHARRGGTGAAERALEDASASTAGATACDAARGASGAERCGAGCTARCGARRGRAPTSRAAPTARSASRTSRSASRTSRSVWPSDASTSARRATIARTWADGVGRSESSGCSALGMSSSPAHAMSSTSARVTAPRA